MHLLYKLVFHDDTYYIGVTNNLKRRLYEHKNNPNTTNWSKVEILQNNLEENLNQFLLQSYQTKAQSSHTNFLHPAKMIESTKHLYEILDQFFVLLQNY